MKVLDDFEMKVVVSTLEGWELVEFLGIPIEDVLEVALENEWVNEENYEDLMEFVGLLSDEEDDYVEEL